QKAWAPRIPPRGPRSLLTASAQLSISVVNGGQSSMPSGAQSAPRLRSQIRRRPTVPSRLRPELLGALELLPRAGIDRVAAAAHGLPGGELELEQTEVCVVRLV